MIMLILIMMTMIMWQSEVQARKWEPVELKFKLLVNWEDGKWYCPRDIRGSNFGS